jgi:hypothetical protein
MAARSSEAAQPARQQIDVQLDGSYRRAVNSSCTAARTEHWDVLQNEATEAESKSGRPMFGDRFPG